MTSFINMTGDPALYLSPFSAHQIHIWENVFPTVEHAYQWKKFIDEKVKKEILAAPSPLRAWELAQEYKNDNELIDSSFDKDAVMEELFRNKLESHADVKKILFETAEKDIFKIHTEDSYWGTGADGNGQNIMGKLWMRLRDELVTQCV